MRFLAAPLAALALVAAGPVPTASPAPPAAGFRDLTAAPTFAHAGGHCARPRYDGHQGVTALIAGAGTTPTSAVVVEPERPPSAAPAVLWVHWLGDPATTNHTEFLADAQALAGRGVVSLLVDMPWSQPNWFESVRKPETDYDDVVAQVVTLRRALDCLSGLPGVDPARIAYVGHDFGAMDGALLLAADERVRYAVLMAPTLTFWEWDLLGAQPADRDAYVTRMSAFDLPRWLPKGHQRATLLQFANRDEYVAQSTALVFRNAVPATDRTLKRYDADHSLAVPAAVADRRTWLLTHLGV